MAVDDYRYHGDNLWRFALGKPYWTLESMPVWLALVVLLIVLWRGSILHRRSLGLLVLATAISLVIARDLGIAVLVYGSLVYLFVAGVLSLSELRERNWSRASLGSGLVLFSILGAYWVDITSILLGLLIAPMLVISGSLTLHRVWRGRSPRSSRIRFIDTLVRIGSVVVLLLAMATSVLTFQAIRAEPEHDSFSDYDQPLGDEPGRLLRAMPFTRGMPDDSNATRILYTTTGHQDEIVLATGLVIVSDNVPQVPLPVILWTHGTTGVAVTCAPTLLDDPLGSGAMMFPDLPLEQGWAIVAPDYLGLGASAPHPYMVGAPAARSSLDAVRAARQLDTVSLSDATVVWGHSQGGGSALWVGIEQESYAPEVPLLGVAALAPASQLPRFIDTLMSGVAGPVFGGYILRGYADWYDNVAFNDYVRPGARFSQQKIVSRCISEPSFIANVASALIREPYTQADIRSGPLYERLEENIPDQPTGIPTFIGQGEADTLIVPDAQDEFVANLCDSGQVVEYYTVADRDHLGVVAEDSPLLPDLMSWTEARFAGKAPAESCSTIQR